MSCSFISFGVRAYDVAVAESNMGIFVQSTRKIRNCALFGNYSFYFSFSAEKQLLLIFRLFFGRKKYFSLLVVLLFRPKTEKIIVGPPLEIGTVGNVAYNSTFAYSVYDTFDTNRPSH